MQVNGDPQSLHSLQNGVELLFLLVSGIGSMALQEQLVLIVYWVEDIC